jgi:hypothetical protein
MGERVAMSATAKAIEARHQEELKFLQSLSRDLPERLAKLARTKKPFRRSLGEGLAASQSGIRHP